MVKILIVDDNPEKLRRIKDVALKFPELALDHIVCVTTAIEAKRLLAKDYYDLLILDINIPERAEDLPSAQTGIRFLGELNSSHRLKKPYHIIGITAYEDAKSSSNKAFEDSLWFIIKYDEQNVNWEYILKSKIEYLIQSKRDLLIQGEIAGYQYDLAIITALRKPELQAVLNLDGEWISFKQQNDSVEFHKGFFSKGEKKISVVCACTTQMGMVATSVLTSKLINYFRPRYIAMVGISAAIKRENVGYGDVLAAEFVFDYESGKLTKSEGEDLFLPDHKQIKVSQDIINQLNECQGSRKYLNEIFTNWPSKKPNTVLNLHVGPMGSGAGVIANESFIQSLVRFQRKLIGIDMETYGMYFAAENSFKPKPLGFLSVKSVSDFGSQEKNDDFQEYAAYTSAQFLYHFATEYLCE